ncbi:LysM domain-containing protein [Paraperlucidibaca baekdonensis]|uniref:LysM domain-containing protein n=1 Tax=Paraperlucidibaca baekdonensis TaxID=748120 RepID=A0A3E0H3U3_9GAMM|nr:transglycosylase SLT domain-containing protein [Paraperlucidibaca baekdonensis]REH36965.1 LysM domain-containing protein [Paraperlucidibaca baekdonensis]
MFALPSSARFFRLLAVASTLSFLTACASAPTVSRATQPPMKQKAPEPAASVHESPASFITRTIAPATSDAEQLAIDAAEADTAISATLPVTDDDPALAESIVISVPVAAIGNPSSSTNLVQRLRRGFKMPTRYNARISAEFTRFAGQQRYIDELMERASRFMYTAVAEAERRGLPTELALLPIIESAYDPSATSRSNAAGLWQFIPDTGRLYGLRQTYWFDARRDPLESTRAAYDYLAKLYGMFGDWDLVLASYNAGPGTVSRAMSANAARGRSTDYWSLNLSAEATAYVPRFLAVVSLFKDPVSAGVSIPSIPNRPYFRTIAAQGTLSLDTVAALSGIQLEELQTLNAGLLRDKLAPNGPFLLHVPSTLDAASERLLVQQSSASDVRVATADGSSAPVAALPSAQLIRASFIEANSRSYRIQRGDSWYKIARANHLSQKQLVQANNDSLSTILDVGRVIIIPTPAAAAYQAHTFSGQPTPSPPPRPTQVIQTGNREL